MVYNTTAMESSNGISSLFDAVFKMTNASGQPIYFLGYGVLVLVFIGLFVMMKRQNEFVIAMLGASFISTIIAAIMGYLGYIQWIGALVPLLLFVGSLLYYLFNNQGGG